MRNAGLADYWSKNGWADLCHSVGADDFVSGVVCVRNGSRAFNLSGLVELRERGRIGPCPRCRRNVLDSKIRDGVVDIRPMAADDRVARAHADPEIAFPVRSPR